MRNLFKKSKNLFRSDKVKKTLKPNLNYKDKPLLSVIMACRVGCTPTSDIQKAISTMVDMAHDPKNLELCIKFDDDDVNVEQALKDIKPFTDQLNRFKYIITPRGGGYDDFHFYHYSMVKELSDSSCPGILHISDDSEFLCKDYDLTFIDFLKKQKTDVFCFQTRVIGKYSYPIWSRRFFETVGLGYIASFDIWGESIIKVVQDLCDRDDKISGVKVNFWAEEYTKNKSSIIERHLAPDDNTLDGIRGEAIKKLSEFTQTPLWKRSVKQHGYNLYNIVKMQLS